MQISAPFSCSHAIGNSPMAFFHNCTCTVSKLYQLGCENLCFFLSGHRKQVRIGVFLRITSERQNGGFFYQNQHFSFSQEGGAKMAVFRIVLHTFYTRRAKISTTTFVREEIFSGNRKDPRTQSVVDQPRSQAKPVKMEAAPPTGQPVLVQLLAGAESLHPSPPRADSHGAGPRK